jgi:hypothetical protein
MFCCTFDASRVVSTEAFCVFKSLTTFALRYFSFGVGASNCTVIFKSRSILCISLLFVFGFRSIKCSGNCIFVSRCLTFQIFVTSCPLS